LLLEGVMRRLVGIAAIASFLALSPLPLRPCSVGPGYRVPSDYELVKSHEVIVLARSEDFAGGTFIFRIQEVLKGSYPNLLFKVGGHDNFQGRTAEDDLISVREGALGGSCTAEDYRVGYNYVLFCDRTDGGLFVHGPPFSRINEEVDGEGSPWTQAIERYAEIAAFEDPEAEHVAIHDLLKKASERSDPSRCPPAMARDLAEYLGSPSRYMPWTVLEEMHVSARTDDGRSAVLKAMAGCTALSDRPKVRAFLRKLQMSSLGTDDLACIATLASRVQEFSSVGTLLELFTDQEEVGRAIRQGADASLIPAVVHKLPTLPPKGLALLAPLFDRFPSEEAKRILGERARMLATEIGGRYDDRWWDSVALAALGNEEVVDWAIADLERGRGGGCCGLHFYILAWSPLEKADRRAKTIIEDRRQERNDVWALLGGYEASPWPPRWDRLREIAMHPVRRVSAMQSLRRFMNTRVEAGDEEAVELIAILHENELPAPPEPRIPSRFPMLWIILPSAVGCGLAVALVIIWIRRTHRSTA
jgi:hypothetical protein